jgi:hypothetical protein
MSFDDFFRRDLWDDGSIFDLNSLISSSSKLNLHFPTIINDRGEIAGQGQLLNGTFTPSC